MRFATPRPGSSVPSGSTSITISRPGRTTWPGITALADFDRLLSSTSVGMAVGLGGGDVLHMRLATACVKADAHRGVALVRGLLGGHEGAQQTPFRRL